MYQNLIQLLSKYPEWSKVFGQWLVIVWHSNTDIIGKLKYMIKLESDIYYGQTQICDQNCCLYMVKAKYMVKFYMIKLKYMVKRKLWSFCPYMVKHAANIIMVKIQEDPLA